jgi:hypothetical protein
MEDWAAWPADLPTWWRLRVALRTGSERLDDRQQTLITALRRHSRRLWRAWSSKRNSASSDQSTEATQARAYLNSWITAALRSRYRTDADPGPAATRPLRRRERRRRTRPVQLPTRRYQHQDQSQRRGYGHPRPDILTATIYLCLGGFDIPIPTQT